MAKFELVFKRSVKKDFRRIPKKDVQRILTRIDALAREPHPSGAEKLSAQGRYRVRRGVYRILYEINDEELVVVVVKVGHRRHVYQRS